MAVLAACALLSSPRASAEDSAPDAGPVLLDEIVAIISTSGAEERAVLWSDLFLEARLLALKSEGPEAFLALPGPKQLSRALDTLIDERVVFDEAERLQVFVVPETELDQAMRDLRNTVGPKRYDNFMTEKGIGDKTVREIVDRGLRARRYLVGRLGPSARPKEPELAAWFEEHSADFPGQTLAQAKPVIQERLTQERLAMLTEAFTREVRGRARIRILHDPALPATELPMAGSATAPRTNGRAE